MRYQVSDNQTRPEGERYSGPWVTLYMAQRIAAERGTTTYVWQNGVHVATAEPDGKVEVTL